MLDPAFPRCIPLVPQNAASLLPYIASVLMQDWQAQQKAKREKIQQRLVEGRDPEESTEEEDEEEELPFACYICRRHVPLSERSPCLDRLASPLPG